MAFSRRPAPKRNPGKPGDRPRPGGDRPRSGGGRPMRPRDDAERSDRPERSDRGGSSGQPRSRRPNAPSGRDHYSRSDDRPQRDRPGRPDARPRGERPDRSDAPRSRRGDAPAQGDRPQRPGRPTEGRPGQRPSTPTHRPRPQGGAPRGKQRPGRPTPEMEIRWENFRPLFDFWGNKIPRYYRLESLARAVEGVIRGNDKIIVPSVQQLMGPAPVTSLVFELFQEGQFQLIFLLRAMNARHKRALFGLVVAKRPGDFSKVCAVEHENLQTLYARMPDHVVRPFLGGRLIMQDRQLGLGKTHEIYAYATQWLGTYHELGVAKSLQFYVNVKSPQLFTLAQTEDLKGQMVETVVRSYDPLKRDCMEMPQIASGDFVVTKPTQSKPRIKLIACRRLLRNMTPAKILHRILEARYEWGSRTFRLAPEEPETIRDALVRALGKETATAWLNQYRQQLERNDFPEQEPLTREALTNLGIGR